MHDKGIEKIVSGMSDARNAIEKKGVKGAKKEAPQSLREAREAVAEIETEGLEELLDGNMGKSLRKTLKSIEDECKLFPWKDAPGVDFRVPKGDLAKIVDQLKELEEELIDIDEEIYRSKE